MCWTTWTRKAQGSKGQRSGSANVASSNTSSPFKSSLLCAASVTALSHARSGPPVRDFTCGRATLLLFETSTLWIIFRRINNEPLSRWTRATPLLSPSNAVYPLFEAVARLTCFFFSFYCFNCSHYRTTEDKLDDKTLHSSQFTSKYP